MPRTKSAAGASTLSGAARGTKTGTASAFSLGTAARRTEGIGADTASKLAPGLYLVATPIGNLADVTLRALDVLRRTDAVLCEDTRVTAKLLARHGVAAATQPYHDHNAERVRPAILARLKAGAALALVSDAGTPLVSDPGYKLVRAALAEGIAVTVVPGASAALTALLGSGLPPDRFLFAGFLPPKAAARRRTLEEIKDVGATLIVYESAPRLAESLADMAEILGPRPAAVARELTKLHEEVRRDDLAALADHYRTAGPPKGELVLVVGPPPPAAASDAELDRALGVALAHKSLREAVEEVAVATGARRRQVYARALALKGGR
ncbi:MAG: 16S rRNA (cytidine(1402)-2'-O)-methyltransferase [Alphaproteobacteria bacterium]|nr:16S rRNA (cytidine(1402)-2'-O)-methyltransferase [Alphaproteobacteria bacterium]